MGCEIRSNELAPNAHLIELLGECDMNDAPKLKAELNRAVAGESRAVLVDLAAATFFDSSVIATLITALRQLDEQGRELSLVCRDPHHLKVLKIAGLDQALPIHRTRETAIEAIASQDGQGAEPPRAS